MDINMNTEELHIARDMLGYYNLPGGFSPGGFTSALIRTLEVADVRNTARILNEFKEFQPAYTIMTLMRGEALSRAVAAQTK